MRATTIWVLVVDSWEPGSTVETTVHATKEAAIDYLVADYDPDGESGGDVQWFCDHGYVVYLDQFDVPEVA